MDDDDRDTLRRAEISMTVEAARVAVELVIAVERVLAAGRALAELCGPAWGGVVDEWHTAASTVTELVEANDAYENYPPYQWWA